MLAVVVIAAAALLLGAIELGFIAPLHAKVIIRIRNGALSVQRGRLHGSAVMHMESILKEEGVTSGFVAITSGPRVRFSWQIPQAVRQRLRNVLLNQWR